MNDLPTSTHRGTFRVFGVEVVVHHLDDGRRVIESDSMAALLDAMTSDTPDRGDVDGFVRFVSGR